MSRRIALLAIAALVSSLGTFVPAGPASAADVCASHGNANLSTGFGLPILTSNTGNFTFGSGLLDVCISGGGLTATGTMTGACGSGSGRGSFNNGNTFSLLIVRTVMVW